MLGKYKNKEILNCERWGAILLNIINPLFFQYLNPTECHHSGFLKINLHHVFQGDQNILFSDNTDWNLWSSVLFPWCFTCSRPLWEKKNKIKPSPPCWRWCSAWSRSRGSSPPSPASGVAVVSPAPFHSQGCGGWLAASWTEGLVGQSSHVWGWLLVWRWIAADK